MKHNKSFKCVPALRASTGPKKAAPFWAALLKRYIAKDQHETTEIHYSGCESSCESGW